MSILAGAYETVLVVAHCKSSMGDRWGISNWSYDPIDQQPLGIDDLSAAALQASRLSASSQPPPPPHPAPVSDGAAAVVLAMGPAPTAVCGMGWALDEHYLGDRDLSDSAALRRAASRAYALAGIVNPRFDLDVAEISDHFAHQGPLWASALDLIGFPSLNPSGGLGRGVPPFVAGLDRLIHVVRHLQKRPGLGLAQGCWGPAGQGQVVVLIESDADGKNTG
jgi:acetyl-CoA acetyltransferase